MICIEWRPRSPPSLPVMGCKEGMAAPIISHHKPTPNTTIRSTTAMAENPKIQCLSNDLVRRLGNTDDRQQNSRMQAVLDQT